MSQTIFTSAQNITTIQLQFIIDSTVVRNWNTTCLTKPKYLPQQKYKTYNCNALEYGTSYSFYLSLWINSRGIWVSLQGLSIYYVIRDRGEGSSRFITILHRGGLPNLLQYYIGGVLKVYYNITVLKGKWKVIFLFQL